MPVIQTATRSTCGQAVFASNVDLMKRDRSEMMKKAVIRNIGNDDVFEKYAVIVGIRRNLGDVSMRGESGLIRDVVERAFRLAIKTINDCEIWSIGFFKN